MKPTRIQVAIDKGSGLKEAFQDCLKSKSLDACKAEVNDALHSAEITAIANYTAAIDLIPEHKDNYIEIRADENDHKNILAKFL
jgi:hypothetical protein